VFKTTFHTENVFLFKDPILQGLEHCVESTHGNTIRAYNPRELNAVTEHLSFNNHSASLENVNIVTGKK